MKTVIAVVLVVMVLFPIGSVSAAGRTVHLRLFRDDNVNGIKDSGEPWLANQYVQGYWRTGCSGSWNFRITKTNSEGYAEIVPAFEEIPNGVSICVYNWQPVDPDRCISINQESFQANMGTLGSFVWTRGAHSGCPGY